jgi:sugar lactone lactonase YvrE
MNAVPLAWRVAVSSGCELAEHPVWDHRSNTLLWVDVLMGALHWSVPPAEGSSEWADRTALVGGVVGAAALRRDGGCVAAVDSAVVMLDALGRPDAEPVPVDMPAGARFNDGACDPAGRFLVGSTSPPDEPGAGVLWSLRPSGRVELALTGVTESNGLDWAPAGDLLYYVDSGEPVVRRYAYDTGSGRIGARLTDLTVLSAGEGVPDGLVVDADGAVWVALWEGASLRRYAPDGELLLDLAVPVGRPTCAAFAGADLTVLVLATAWEGLDAEGRRTQPWAGHVLVAPAPARGRLPHRFAGVRR